MFVLILLLLAFVLTGILFFGSVPLDQVLLLEYLALLLLAAAAVIQSFSLVRRRAETIPRSEAVEEVPAPPPPATGADGETAVVQFLGRLQEKGRLIDFVMEDIIPFNDQQVAAAARVVHQGCREVMQSAFDLQPVHGGAEGEAVTLAGDYDARRYRLVGKVPDQAPFHGTVLHRGWRTGRVTLPRVVGGGETAREVVAPAEVEVG